MSIRRVRIGRFLDFEPRSAGRTPAGTLTYNDEHSAVRRPNYRATLRGTLFDTSDIAPLMGMAFSSTANAACTDHVPPHGKFETARLEEVDAEVDLNIVKVTATSLDVARRLQLRATLQGGVLRTYPQIVPFRPEPHFARCSDEGMADVPIRTRQSRVLTL